MEIKEENGYIIFAVESALLERANSCFSLDTQLDKLQEECAEVIQIRNKLRINEATMFDVIEEVVDNTLMNLQILSRYRELAKAWMDIKRLKVITKFESVENQGDENDKFKTRN